MNNNDIIIKLEHISKSFDKKVLDDINLYIKKGEFITLLGPSGCGKTTTLRMIAGFCTPDEGQLLMDGKDISNVPPYNRPFNTVFQRYALFPHLDVYDNVAFGLKLNKLPEKEIDKRVRKMLKLVSMSDYEDRDVNSLSGGQQQRVAIARALVNYPKVLLLDEPLAALDLKMRKDMQIELKEMHQKLGITFIYVTHDQLEAMTLATHICLINNGVVQQYDAPLDVYKRPNNLFVADFVGNPAINLIEAQAKQDEKGIHLDLFGGQVKATFVPNTFVDLAKFRVQADEEEAKKAKEYQQKLADKHFVEKGNSDKAFDFKIPTINGTLDSKDEKEISNQDFVIGIRPEFLRIEDGGKLETEVYSAMPSGMETTVKLRVGEFLITSVVFGGVDYKVNAKAKVNVVGKEILLFDRKTQRLIASGELELC